MSDEARFHLVEDTRFQEHRGPDGHPERPARLDAVSTALSPFAPALVRMPLRAATTDELLRIHDRTHLAQVSRTSERAPAMLDPDTYLSPASLGVALEAAGGTVDVARAVATGAARYGMAAVRPPGHHAEHDRAMGFCIFNNVAIAARALQAEEGVGKLMIFDWDVHHGNGTQHSFEEDASILYVSTHQFPHYPGTGRALEVGRGAGAGATLNIPVPAGSGDAEYVSAVQRLVIPVARHFAPEMILISCGFDAHRDDPLSATELTGEGYLAMTWLVRALADELCEGRLALVLEGGYALSGLAEGTTAVMRGLLEPMPEALPPVADLPPGSNLAAIVAPVVEAQRRFHPDIGAA